ncbi:MAG: DUF5131 family protein [Gemmatimonadota bacterium]
MRTPDLFPSGALPHHIWIGTSIEHQDTIYRADHLRYVPARVRFIIYHASCAIT